MVGGLHAGLAFLCFGGGGGVWGNGLVPVGAFGPLVAKAA